MLRIILWKAGFELAQLKRILWPRPERKIYYFAFGANLAREVLQQRSGQRPVHAADERKKLERLSEGVPAVTSVGQPLRKSDFRLRQAATSATSGAGLGDTHSPGDKIRTDRLRANGQRWREKVVEYYFNNTSILT